MDWVFLNQPAKKTISQDMSTGQAYPHNSPSRKFLIKTVGDSRLPQANSKTNQHSVLLLILGTGNICQILAILSQRLKPNMTTDLKYLIS